jgi:hypothetical protein
VENAWESRELYQQPARHGSEGYGRVCLSKKGVYSLRIDHIVMSCAQAWASRIRAFEGLPEAPDTGPYTRPPGCRA